MYLLLDTRDYVHTPTLNLPRPFSAIMGGGEWTPHAVLSLNALALQNRVAKCRLPAGNGLGQSSLPSCVQEPFGKLQRAQASTVPSTILTIYHSNSRGQKCSHGLFDSVQPLAEQLHRKGVRSDPSTRSTWIKVATILDNGESRYDVQTPRKYGSLNLLLTEWHLADGTLFSIHSHQQPISDMI